MRQMMYGGMVTGLLAVALTTGWSQETKPTGTKPTAAKPESATAASVEAKPSNRLPNNYGKLELSGAQKDSIYQVQDKYGSEIDALIKQVESLRQKRDAEIAAVLTAEQKDKLKALLADSAKKAAAKKAAAKPTDSKADPTKPSTN